MPSTMQDPGPVRHFAAPQRLAGRLDEPQRHLATCRTFDEPGAGEVADRLAAVALAIEELDALIRQDDAAASG